MHTLTRKKTRVLKRYQEQRTREAFGARIAHAWGGNSVSAVSVDLQKPRTVAQVMDRDRGTCASFCGDGPRLRPFMIFVCPAVSVSQGICVPLRCC